jgi:hypothetical protein
MYARDLLEVTFEDASAPIFATEWRPLDPQPLIARFAEEQWRRFLEGAAELARRLREA